MALNARHRYIVWNTGLWCTLAAVGVIAIGLLRQYGSILASHEKAHVLVARADAHWQEGDLNSCQAEILQALTLAPGLVSEVVDRFGMRLSGLPALLEDLAARARQSPDPASPDALAAAQLELMQGNLATAAQLTDHYITAGGRNPIARLWRGRIALNAADFAKAQSEFARYWTASGAAKNAFTPESRVRAGGTDAEQRMQDGRTLFWAGLWDDAMDAFADARKAGGTDPELDFFQGVASDLAGETAAARESYAKTLSRLPNHLLSLRRLHALSAPSAAG